MLRVSWRADDASNELHLKWSESGGPAVNPPATTGYGTQLIQSAVSYSLGGRVEQNYAATGLESEIVIPLGKASLSG